MSKGGMQTSVVKELICKCGKPTSKTIEFTNGNTFYEKINILAYH